MKCSYFLTVLLLLFISKVSGDVTPKFLYNVLSNRITVDGELLRNEIRDTNSRIDTLVNTVNELTGLIKTGNGMDAGEGLVQKPVDKTVAMKHQKYEKIVNKVLAAEKMFLRGEIKKVTEQMSKLTSETSVLKNALDILEDSMLIRFEETVKSNKRELENLKSSITASVNVLKDKHLTDLKNSENKVLERISGISSDLASTNYQVSSVRSDLSSTNYKVSGIKSREEKRKISFTARLHTHRINLPGGSKLILDYVLHNDGNGYSNTTGIFTCPESGVYLFVCFVAIKPSASTDEVTSLNVLIQVNGYTKNQALSRSHHQHQTVQGGTTIVFSLNYGDRVWLETNDGVGIQSVRGFFTTFSGIMLY